MSLFSSVTDDEELRNIDNQIDSIFLNIPKNNLDTTSTEDLTGSVLNSIIGDEDQDEITRLFENVTVPHARVQRYNVYEELNRAVPIIKRIIRVYIANILQKNPVDGQCILIKAIDEEDEEIKQKTKLVKKYVEKIIKNFKILPKLKNLILPHKLLYGDSFIEIVNISEQAKKIKVSDSLALMEVKNLEHEVNLINKYNNLNKTDYKYESILNKLANLLIIVEDEEENKNIKSNKNNEDEIKGDLENILLRIHKPHNIITLANNYGTVVGYLEVERYTSEYGSMNDISKTLSQTVGKVSTIEKQNSTDQKGLINKLIGFMIKKLLKKHKQSGLNPDADIDSIIKNLDEDTYKFIRRLIVEQGLEKKSKFNQVKIRFINPENIINMQIPSSEYFPYGDSIIDPLVFPSKLYILAQLANVITKLSRASLVRKWILDVGPTQMHAAQIQKLKRELYNTRVTLDDLGSFKSIPKILSD